MFRDHLKNFDWWLLLGVAFLVSLSILMFFGGMGQGDSGVLLEKQLLFLGVGSILMFGISLFDYRRFKAYSALSVLLYIVAIVSLVAVLMIGFEIRGAVSWFKIGQFSLEPVEFVKIAMVVLFAKFFTIRHAEIFRPAHLILSAIYLVIPVGLVLLQPDFGSAMLLTALWAGMMIVAGIKKKHLVILFFIGAVLFAGMWFGAFKDYQKARVSSFLNPLSDPYGSGYNIIQSRIAIGAGGIFGAGLGQGTQTRLGFLPEAHTDFIFAAIAEEFGLLGVIFIFGGYAFITWRILSIARISGNNFAKLFCYGFLILIFSQFVINVGMNMGLMPVTGITLPFLSYGGSSLISLFLGIGIIQSIKVRSFKVIGEEI